MIKHQFNGKKEITIVPIADVHFGAGEQMEEAWTQFLATVKKNPDVYITLGGDLLNNGIKNSVTNVYREKYMPREARRMMADMLAPVRDRIICAVTGNHERRSIKEVDDDPMYAIMAKLDLEHLYRENIAFVKIQMGKERTRETGTCMSGENRPTYMLAVTHGAGGGMYVGSSSVKSEKFGYVIDGIDALIVGHTHKPFVSQPGKIHVDPRNDRVSIKPFKVISATSWLGYSDYAIQKMLFPTTHCLHTLTLSGRRKEIVVTM